MTRVYGGAFGGFMADFSAAKRPAEGGFRQNTFSLREKVIFMAEPPVPEAALWRFYGGDLADDREAWI